VLSRGWTSSGIARLIVTRNDAPRRSSVITGRAATRHVGDDHQARAIRLKDAERREKLAIAGASRTAKLEERNDQRA
jgi:hypothetical protein